VTLTFSSIDSEGGITVTTSTAPPATQTGFQLNGVYYDVSTTAGYSGLITITLPYDPNTVSDPQTLRLYHYDKGLNSWIDVTTGVDTTNHTVSGQVTSFSWFAAGAPGQIFSGFLPPISSNGNSLFKLGQRIPVKFQLTDSSGSYITNAVARIYIAKLNNGVPGTEQPGVSNQLKLGNTFQYTKSQDQYIFNLETKNLSPGVWRIRVILDDGLSHNVLISISAD